MRQPTPTWLVMGPPGLAPSVDCTETALPVELGAGSEGCKVATVQGWKAMVTVVGVRVGLLEEGTEVSPAGLVA